MKCLKKFSICALLSLLFLSSPISAQHKPYFQQKLEYKIHVTLNDSLHEARGTDTIFYTNQSPDTLIFLYFHLWPNATINNKTALAKQYFENRNLRLHHAKNDERGWIKDLDFCVDGQKVQWHYDSINPDVAKIILNTPLEPQSRICITTPFHIKIPYGRLTRFGHIDQAYYFTQWYPKPAVYDRYGWHAMPYLNFGEYYGEFAKFDVFIILPKNYVVASTGYLVNGGNEEQWLAEKVRETEQIQEFDNTDNAFPPSDKELKTLHFRRDSVHDFAWFADKRYHVLQDTIILPHSKRKVISNVYFTNRSAFYWKRALGYIDDAVNYYSTWLGDYPYERVAAADVTSGRGGGMEYPCITAIGNAYGHRSLEYVIMHEVGHNWLYGILANNERRYPFMDEGFNTYYDNRYQSVKFEEMVSADTLSFFKTLKEINTLSKSYQNYMLYLIMARHNLHQALDLHSNEYSGNNYGVFTYSIPAAQIRHLEHYLGTAAFDSVMQKYYEQWQFQHPYPEDLQNIFEKYASKNCRWFFEEVLKSRQTNDYAFGNVKYKNGAYTIIIKNKGRLAMPFALGAYKNNVLADTQWIKGFTGKKLISVQSEKVDRWKIDATGTLMDINRYNNGIKAHGILKKWKPLHPKLIHIFEKPHKNEFGILPALGWNEHNGLLSGVVLYSNPLLARKFDYILMPLWSEKTAQIAGYTDMGYTFHLPGYAHTLRTSITGSRYAYSNYQRNYFYQKMRFDILWNCPRKAVSTIFQKVKYAMHYIEKEELQYRTSYGGRNELIGFGKTSYPVHELWYQFQQTRVLNPYSVKTKFELMDRELKFSLESKLRMHYQKQNKYVEARGFFGTFLSRENKYNVDNRFRLSSWTGTDDYLFTHYFVARDVASNHFLSQQLAENDGGFKIYTYYGQTRNWLAAVNLKTTMPGKIPFMLYADIGTYCNIKKYSQFNETVYYDAGVSLPLIKGICEVYFPAIQSKDLKENSNYITNNNYWQKIRFSLYLERLHPADFINKNILNSGGID